VYNSRDYEIDIDTLLAQENNTNNKAVAIIWKQLIYVYIYIYKLKLEFNNGLFKTNIIQFSVITCLLKIQHAHIIWLRKTNIFIHTLV